MAKRKQYDDEFRSSACLMLEAAGYPETKGALEHVSKHLGVHARTLSRWFKGEQNPPPDRMVTEKRPELADMIRKEIYALFDEMPNAREEANYKDMGVVFGILADKLQLLTGQPTERLAFVHEETQLADDFERLINRAAASIPAGNESADTQSTDD